MAKAAERWSENQKLEIVLRLLRDGDFATMGSEFAKNALTIDAHRDEWDELTGTKT